MIGAIASVVPALAIASVAARSALATASAVPPLTARLPLRAFAAHVAALAAVVAAFLIGSVRRLGGGAFAFAIRGTRASSS
jgi:hypothetical protein